MEIQRCSQRALARTGCKVKDFRELKVWQKAHELTLAVYQVTASFPHQELYGLTTQMRRAGTSIAANLAEGCGRHGDAELSRFCSIALALPANCNTSCCWRETCNFSKAAIYDRLAEKTTEVKRMLTGFLHKLKAAG